MLLAGSAAFYYKLSGKDWRVFGLTLLMSYFMGLALDYMRCTGKSILARRLVLAGSVVAVALPLVVTKHGNFVLQSLLHRRAVSWIVPLGLSFYTLQIIAYLADISRGLVRAQKNPGKYALFVMFFPQMIQGPIPRYGQLAPELYEGHGFDEKGFCKGLQMIVWGFFLKLMIADKASVVVNTVFDSWEAYRGCYVLAAGILYSFQLYADFLSCVCLAKGVSELFGIHLTDNFRCPYRAESVKEFWGRWHMSLSSWLRDTIYIPLGGNRKGTVRKYINILVTFMVSGIWHGAGYKYLFWGMIHAAYQIAGDMTGNLQDRVYRSLGMARGGVKREAMSDGLSPLLLLRRHGLSSVRTACASGFLCCAVL